jgi:CubicO group peptidase (beta-lactamase class C family)
VPVAPWLRELAQMKVLKNPTDALDTAVPAARPIRLVDLLTHRSGIPADVRTGPIAAAFREIEAARAISGEEWLKRVAATPLVYEPGTRFAYGNSFDALGILVERVAQMPFAEFLRRRIFEPLGMNDTGYMLPKEKLPRLAAMSTSGTPTPARGSAGDKMPPFTSGAYGLMSTLDDYLKFARMLLGRGALGNTRIISHRAVEYMTTNYLTPEQRKMPFSNIENFWAGEGFGLGVAVRDNLAIDSNITGVGSPGTFSWPGAYGTWWEVDPKEDMIQIYMVQGGNNIPSRRAFQATVYEAIND